MKWKNRLTNYNFWISIASAILLIIQAFKIEFNIAYLNEIATAVLGILVMIGIISDPTKIAVDSKEEIKQEKTEEKGEEKNSTPTLQKIENDLRSCEDDYKAVVSKAMDDLKNMLNEFQPFHVANEPSNVIEESEEVAQNDEEIVNENLEELEQVVAPVIEINEEEKPTV